MLVQIKKYLFLLVFWFIPLFLGVSIFISWRITNDDQLMLFGVYTLYLGIFTVTIGSIILLIQALLKKGNHLKIKFALLVSNIPIGLGIAYLAISLITQFVVTIENNTNVELKNCVIDGGGVSIQISSIDPHSRVKKRFFIKHDGVLYFRYQQNEESKKVLVQGYVTNGSGGNEEIKIE